MYIYTYIHITSIACLTCIPTGAAIGVNEQFDPPAHPPPGLQRAVNKLPNGQTNGHSCHLSSLHDSPGVRNDLSAGEGISSDEDEEEESFSPRWKGIESIFEAYEEYMEGEFTALDEIQTCIIWINM